MEYRISEIILLFFVYGFLGWCCEVAFAACKEGKFVNRGFLNGPICPIYGFGVVGVVFALAPVRDNPWLLYLGSVALTSAIEFIAGFLLEKIFHARWWDYSGMPLNIMGHVCLLFSAIWGLACMAIVYWGHPLIAAAVSWLPSAIRIGLDIAFCSVFILDLCATVTAVHKLAVRLEKLGELGREIHAISDEIGQSISSRTLEARKYVQESGESLAERRARIATWMEQQREQRDEKSEALRARIEGVRTRVMQIMDEKGFGHRRLLNAFPNLRSIRNPEALEALRDFYEKHRRRKKD